MRVHVYPADSFACGHYRMVWPALAIHDQEPSIEVTVTPAGDETGLKIYYEDGSQKVRNVIAPECDVLVLQRPTFPQVAAAVPVLRAKGIAVVVDIDDDLGHIHPDNPAWLSMHPEALRVQIRDDDRQLREGILLPHLIGRRPGGGEFVTIGDKRYNVLGKRPAPHSWRAVSEACAAATLTTVSTPALLGVYGAGNGRVIRNYIPKAALDIPRQDSTVVGWAGSTHSHPGDLREMGPAIARLGCEFTVVGSGAGADRELGLRDPVPDSGQIDFGDWPVAVSQLGVGVAPLAESRFNRAKSWLKPLEYSAVGVPWVASPRPEYRALAELGAGRLAGKPKEWERELRRLITDDAYRQEQSEAVRAIARTLTIEEHAWRYAEVWAEALRIQRSTVPQAV